jgi:hypothetical protein
MSHLQGRCLWEQRKIVVLDSQSLFCIQSYGEVICQPTAKPLASCTVGHILFASSCTACIWTCHDCQQSNNLYSFSPISLIAYHSASSYATCLLNIMHPYFTRNRICSFGLSTFHWFYFWDFFMYHTQANKHGMYLILLFHNSWLYSTWFQQNHKLL